MLQSRSRVSGTPHFAGAQAASSGPHPHTLQAFAFSRHRVRRVTASPTTAAAQQQQQVGVAAHLLPIFRCLNPALQHPAFALARDQRALHLWASPVAQPGIALVPRCHTSNQRQQGAMAHATVIGVPKEIKTDEHRVAATPGSVKSLVAAGFTVVVEKGAGVGSGHSDEAYAKVRVAAKRCRCCFCSYCCCCEAGHLHSLRTVSC